MSNYTISRGITETYSLLGPVLTRSWTGAVGYVLGSLTVFGLFLFVVWSAAEAGASTGGAVAPIIALVFHVLGLLFLSLWATQAFLRLLPEPQSRAAKGYRQRVWALFVSELIFLLLFIVSLLVLSFILVSIVAAVSDGPRLSLQAIGGLLDDPIRLLRLLISSEGQKQLLGLVGLTVMLAGFYIYVRTIAFRPAAAVEGRVRVISPTTWTRGANLKLLVAGLATIGVVFLSMHFLADLARETVLNIVRGALDRADQLTIRVVMASVYANQAIQILFNVPVLTTTMAFAISVYRQCAPQADTIADTFD